MKTTPEHLTLLRERVWIFTQAIITVDISLEKMFTSITRTKTRNLKKSYFETHGPLYPRLGLVGWILVLLEHRGVVQPT